MKDLRIQRVLAGMTGPELDKAYQDCFSTPSGQLVLEDLKNRCYSFSPFPTAEQALYEGMRCVILTIEARIQPEETTV